IQRIEVISGPGATLWGANAMNVVINIITRNSSDTQGGLITVGGGNYELYDGIEYGGRLSPELTYRVHGEFTHFNAFPAAGGGNAGDAWYKPQGGFRLDWNPPGQALSLQGDFFDAAEQPGGTVRGGDAMVSYNRDLSGGSHLQLLAYYDNAQRWSNNGLGFAVNTYDLEIQHSFKFAGWNSVVWGAGERVVDYQIHFASTSSLRYEPARATLNLANIFAQDTIGLAPSLKLTLGLKLEDEPYAGVQPMPSIRLGWTPANHVFFWAAVSRAVRSPTPVDTTIQEFVGPRDILNGTTNFMPEKVTAYEIGTRVQVSRRASLSVSGFYNVYNDIRSLDLGGPGSSSEFLFGNSVAATTVGVEAWGNYQVTDWWRISAGITAQHESFRFLPATLTAHGYLPEQVGLSFVANDPGHLASLRSTMNFGHGVTLEAFLREVGELPHPVVPGYTELNARIGWQVNHRLNLSLSGFNLLHRYHLEFINPGQYTEVPRMIFAQAQVRF
ncbi:MAG TPA: TonB-dependent receptor, partial [Acetobacteraceae bacterium]|nr:TonB-dependent receptor [Acetobacteraceae bacterium]